MSEAPVVGSLARMLDVAEPLARLVIDPGGLPAPVRPMLWDCAVGDIRTPHAEHGLSTRPVELYAVANAVVGGAGGHATVDDAYIWAEGLYPGYVRFWFERDQAASDWRVATAGPPIKLGTAFSITHFNHIWGHWLTEMYPKLLLIRRLRGRGLTAPIVLPATAPGYARTIIEETIPGQEVVSYDPRREHVLVEQLLLPDMLHRQYVFSDVLAQELETEIARSRGARTPMNDRLFVSRRELPSGPARFRELVNADDLEAEARARGFAVIAPETMSWREQIATFAQASVVVGEYGSGLHNALVSPAGTRVVALNWITDVQSRIANFRGHDVGYLLPEDGRPRGFTLESQETQPFRIDPDAFRRALDRVLDPYAPPRLSGYDAVGD